MLLIRNAAQLVCVSRDGSLVRRGAAMQDVAVLENGAVVADGERIAWDGPTNRLPPVPAETEVLDASGKTVLPGFVDSHTHLLFAGSREDEFEQRLRGATYQEIAANGGGINATVQRVRSASREKLKALARPRLQRMLGLGVTT